MVIHGWNPPPITVGVAPANKFIDEPWPTLLSAIDDATRGSDWHVVAYDWTADASTGSLGYDLASVRAVGHGEDIAAALQQYCPVLRQLHFIAHSAGSWAARKALVDLMAGCPHTVTQMTLLDAYVPDDWVVLPPLGLGRVLMNEVPTIPGYGLRIHRLDHYMDDFSWVGAFGTQASFSWRVGIDIGGQRVDFWRGLTPCYNNHSGPIKFLADTVAAVSGSNVPEPCLLHNDAPFNQPGERGWQNIGWPKSLFAQQSIRPAFATQPPSPQNFTRGTPKTLSAGAPIRATNYRWYKKSGTTWLAVSNYSTQPGLVLAGNDADAGTYVLELSNANGLLYSDETEVEPAESIPYISAVAPPVLITQPVGQTQILTVRGTGFTSLSRLEFFNGTTTYSNRVPTFINATELRYNVDVGPIARSWSVKVINGTAVSLSFPFAVVTTVSPLTSVTVSGASTINENTSTQLTATAHFADGSSRTATGAAWRDNSGAVTVSATGLLSAGSVTSDTAVTAFASYEEGGIIREGSWNLTILNVPTGGGSSETRELITNGGFESGNGSWNMAGSVVRSTYPHTGSNYAVMGETANITDTMYQSVTIPSNATAATLSYWYNVTSADTSAVPHDVLGVSIKDSTGTVVEEVLETISNVDRQAGAGSSYYVKDTHSLMAYRGKTVRVFFLATTDATLLTSFKIDDVSVQVTVPVPPPGVPEIALTASGEPIPNGSATVSRFNATDFDDRWIGEETVVHTFIINNYGDGTLHLSGNPLVTLSGSNSFTLSEAPPSEIAADSSDSFRIRFAPQSVGVHNGTVTIRSDDPATPIYTFVIRGEGKFRDTSPPAITIGSPVSGSSFSTQTGTISVGGSASDNVGVTDVQWANDRGGGGIATGTTNWNAPGIVLKSGANLITVTAKDAAGLVGSDALTVNYTPISPEITTSVTSVSQFVQQGSNALSQSFTLQNTGSGTLNYSITITGNPAWVTVNPPSGTSTGEPDTIAINYSTSGLAVGTHNASITIMASGASNSPQTIPLSVTVTGTDPAVPYEATWAGGTQAIVATAVAPAPDGGCVVFGDFTGTTVVGGVSLTAAGSVADIYAVRFGPDHQVIWVKQFGSSAEEHVDSCVVHPLGGWAIAGWFKGTAFTGPASLTASGTNNKSDAFLARIDESGNLVWTRRAGGDKIDYGRHAATDGIGNCYLVGSFQTSATFSGSGTSVSATGTDFDIFVVKYSSAGGFLWAKSAGGTLTDYPNCVAADGSGNLYVGGHFEQQAVFGAHNLVVLGDTSLEDGFLTKIDSSGNFLWARRFGEPAGQFSSDAIQFVAPTNDGRCFFGGHYEASMSVDGIALPTGGGETTAMVGRVGSTGTLEWMKSATTTGFYRHSDSQAGFITSDGGLIFGGHYRGELTIGAKVVAAPVPIPPSSFPPTNAFLAKIDGGGTPLWALPVWGDMNISLDYVGPSAGQQFRIMARADGQLAVNGVAPMTPPSSSEKLLVELAPPSTLATPSLSTLADITIDEDHLTPPIGLVITDADTPPANLTLAASSTNQTLVANGNIAFEGSGSNRNLIITPDTNQHGVTTITVSVSDGANSSSRSFQLTVQSLPDAPDRPVNQIMAGHSSAQSLTPRFRADTFNDGDGDTHAATEWQVLDTSGATIVWSSGDTGNAQTETTIPPGVIDYAAGYRWRVRYRDSAGLWSEFSFPSSFTTAAKPVLETTSISGSDFGLLLRGGVGDSFAIQSSNDLHAWLPVGVVSVPASGAAAFLLPIGNGVSRFYRAVQIAGP